VLHVPSLSTNLLSVHKLTQDLNCHVIFSSHICVFQDLAMEKMIGVAKAQNGLCYLQGNYEPSTGAQPIMAYSSQSTSTKFNILD